MLSICKARSGFPCMRESTFEFVTHGHPPYAFNRQALYDEFCAVRSSRAEARAGRQSPASCLSEVDEGMAFGRGALLARSRALIRRTRREIVELQLVIGASREAMSRSIR